ncbi:hypothetical protein SNOG_20145 [Parastagonospora nodorum SN15]|uniref:Uncharacterized protein n=1 Tax=Phaeosphaeria nodorum (strain SN15 / ATCC MYA-4574 / FGSC 10173) TaxID=321614 RepID=A9JXE2_PHANO|nr:hypothetical protein SNOG_20145 [Parastagonospora nodorum SN15]EDP89831.1 hypothetical protein SNOG_20145 [Parastagonospora nodorum SN15]
MLECNTTVRTTKQPTIESPNRCGRRETTTFSTLL